jgi:NADH-quinone oxidoreductase subunit E
VDTDRVKSIVAPYGRDPEQLIQILQDLNAEFNYLPAEALALVAEELQVPLSRIYSVATFYKAFSLEPRGDTIVKVCMGTACHVRGAQLVMNEAERTLGISAGQTTEDLSHTLEAVNCVGACALAPVVIVNDEYQGGVKTHRVAKVIKARR